MSIDLLDKLANSTIFVGDITIFNNYLFSFHLKVQIEMLFELYVTNDGWHFATHISFLFLFG